MDKLDNNDDRIWCVTVVDSCGRWYAERHEQTWHWTKDITRNIRHTKKEAQDIWWKTDFFDRAEIRRYPID